MIITMFSTLQLCKGFSQSSTAIDQAGQRRRVGGVHQGSCLHWVEQGHRQDDSCSGVYLPVDTSDRLRGQSLRDDEAGCTEQSKTRCELPLCQRQPFRHWTTSQIRCGLESNSEDFLRAKAEEAVERMQEEKKFLDGLDAMTPRKPEVLKNLSLWVKWWELWDNYIYRFRAEARCPLSYIHRAHTEVINEVRDVEYKNLDDHLVNNTVLEGQHFAIDNKCYNAEFKS